MSRFESTVRILCSRNCGLRIEIEGRSFSPVGWDRALDEQLRPPGHQ
jgi:hypothetical protein